MLGLAETRKGSFWGDTGEAPLHVIPDRIAHSVRHCFLTHETSPDQAFILCVPCAVPDLEYERRLTSSPTTYFGVVYGVGIDGIYHAAVTW